MGVNSPNVLIISSYHLQIKKLILRDNTFTWIWPELLTFPSLSMAPSEKKGKGCGDWTKSQLNRRVDALCWISASFLHLQQILSYRRSLQDFHDFLTYSELMDGYILRQNFFSWQHVYFADLCFCLRHQLEVRKKHQSPRYPISYFHQFLSFSLQIPLLFPETLLGRNQQHHISNPIAYLVGHCQDQVHSIWFGHYRDQIWKQNR